jgi:hypothetical protein
MAKSNKADRAQRTPVMPVTSWDHQEHAAPGSVGQSQPAVHIWPEKGTWQNRGTKPGGPMPRKQQYKG